MRRPSIIRCLLAVTFLSIAFAGLAHAQTGQSLTLVQASGSIGSKIDFSGTGCIPDPASTRSTGRFEVYTHVASTNSDKIVAGASFTSNADGSFSGKATVLDTAEAGKTYQTRVVCGEVRIAGPSFTVVGNSTTSTSTSSTTVVTPSTTSTTVAPTAPASVASDTITPATDTPAAASDDTNVAATADQSTTPASTSNTNQLSGAQSTTTTTSASLALTGSDNTLLVLWALSILCFGVAFVLSPYCSWFPGLEKRIRQFGLALADLFAPTPLP